MQGLFLLLCCQLAGEAAARATGLPVPGPVLGIVLLLLLLGLRGSTAGDRMTAPGSPLGSTADTLLRNMGILFVPAGSGILLSFGLVAANGLAIIAALVVSTLITLLVTVAVFRLVSRGIAQRGEAK